MSQTSTVGLLLPYRTVATQSMLLGETALYTVMTLFNVMGPLENIQTKLQITIKQSVNVTTFAHTPVFQNGRRYIRTKIKIIL